MSPLLPSKLQKLLPYEPIDTRYPIHLDANESFVKLPQTVLNEICDIINYLEFNRYPDPLARDVCQAFANLNNIDSKLIVAGNGSDELISVIINAFLQKGDKIITFAPDFSMYKFYSEIAELDCIVLQKDEDFSVDIDKVINIANEQDVKLIIFSNPCNPTAQGIEREDVIKLIENVNAFVVVDEAYMNFWNNSVIDYVNKYENLIVLRSCSKAFALAGLRLGFAVACEKLKKEICKAKSPYNVNKLTQSIGKCILDNTALINAAINSVIESRDYLYKNLKYFELEYGDKFKVYPTKTNFVTIRTKNANEIYDFLLGKGICIRLINSGILRITAGTEQENILLISALKDYFK